jgi:hypothetical protein
LELVLKDEHPSLKNASLLNSSEKKNSNGKSPFRPGSSKK